MNEQDGLEQQHEAEHAKSEPAASLDRVADAERPGSLEPEFKITVRKLTVPTRPRGVLAE